MISKKTIKEECISNIHFNDNYNETSVQERCATTLTRPIFHRHEIFFSKKRKTYLYPNCVIFLANNSTRSIEEQNIID